MSSANLPLLDELRRHLPIDATETSHYRALLTLLEHTPSPFARHTFVPGHVTASLFIVDPGTQQLLLHHHRRLDRWLQMGGHLEPGELPAVAALREGREESGLDDLVLVSADIFDVDVHGIPAGKGEPDHSHFDVRYVARTLKPQAIAMDEAESRDLAWVDFDRAIELMNEEASTRAVSKIRKRLG
jgi:8-oxo-dGTP pyrophosphatase MutT (NUDIX family)